jgi:hypothetical protein
MGRPAGHRALLVSATLNVVLHLAGLLLAAIAIAPGSPIAPLDARLAYLATRPLGWSVGWAIWAACALALVWFVAVLRPYASARSAAAAALALVGVGAAVDLYCDVLQIVELPRLAGAGPALESLFLAVERRLAVGGLVVANGLYSAAVLLIAVSLRGRLPALAFALGVATFLAGMLMVAAGVMADARPVPVATGATILAFVAWVVAVTHGLGGRA